MFVVNICVIFVLIGAFFLPTARCDEWQERVAKLEELVETLNGRITELVAARKEQDRKITEIKQNVSCSCEKEDKDKRLIQGPVTPTTAFYAYLSHDEKSPTTSKTLVFDDVRVNVNNAYSGNSGTFRAPVAGTYVFTFSIRVTGGGTGSYEVIRNGRPEGAAIANIPQTSTTLLDQEQVTGTVVIEADEGDEVYVRTHSSLGHAGDLLSNQHGRCMFAGWMISH